MDRSRHNYTDPWDNGVYGTGKTEPPKNNSGIIALLLIIIIFLSGIVSGLSFMNIRLFQQLQQVQTVAESVPMVFSDTAEKEIMDNNSMQDVLAEAEDIQIPELGLTGSFVTAFDRHYFAWPAGLVVSRVEENGWGHRTGVETGDILIQINENPITTQEELDAFLSRIPEISAWKVLIYRDGMEYILTGSK